MKGAPGSVEQIARELADRLDARGVPYAIGGALALNQWAVPRGTTDLDLNLWVDPTRPTAAAALLGEIGCSLKAAAVIREFTDKGWAYVFYRNVHVDIYLPTRDFHQSVLAQRRARPLLGRDAWFLSPEDLAVFKMILFRPKDLADVESLLLVQGRAFDREHARSWLVKLVGERDPRVPAWDEAVEKADAAIRLRESGWRPPDLTP